MSLQFLSVNKADILSIQSKTQHDIDQDIEILREWIKKEPHLPQNLLEEVNFLEICLMRNKYSIEKTKYKIENYCTLRNQYNYLLEYNLCLNKPHTEASVYHVMPMLTKDKFQRIIIIKIFDEDKYDFTRDVGLALAQRELTSRFDYNDGEIIIADYTSCSSQFATKIRVNVLVHSVALVYNAHSSRMKEIHVVNKWANNLFMFCKPFLPKKIVDRFHGHNDIDSLKKKVPAEYLPSDYGGKQKSLKEIRDQWTDIYKENQELLKMAYKTVTDDTLRIEPTEIGLQGTFKQLVVD